MLWRLSFCFVLSFVFGSVKDQCSVVPLGHRLGATRICGILEWTWQLHDIENAYYTDSV